MSTAELSKYIGKKAEHRTSFYTVNIEIVDMRIIYGREQAKITPLAGHGTSWVRLDSLTNIREGA